VSGEYAMVKAAGEKGWIDGPAVMLGMHRNTLSRKVTEYRLKRSA